MSDRSPDAMVRRKPEVPGQTEAFDSVDDLRPKGGLIYICRECLSSRITGPVVTTVDPRWVTATCMDCGDRVIATVHTPSRRP